MNLKSIRAGLNGQSPGEQGAGHYLLIVAIIVLFLLYGLAATDSLDQLQLNDTMSGGGSGVPTDDSVPTDDPVVTDAPVVTDEPVVTEEPAPANESTAFGLAINPQGPGTDTWQPPDSELLYSGNVGNISLTNEWHHVKQYNRSVEGFEGPVYVIVMADNVHHTNAPNMSEHASQDQPLNWTDSPPENMTIGDNSYSIMANGTLDPVPESSSLGEPTNDIYLVFKPGCEESSVKFVTESAGYNSTIYMNTAEGSVMLIENTNNESARGQVYSAPGVDCSGDTQW